MMGTDGKIWKTGNIAGAIDVSEIPTGLYFLSITNKNKVEVKELVVRNTD